MPVHRPWSLDVDTIVGVAITLLAVLAVQVVFRRRERRQDSAVLAEPVAVDRSRRPGAGGTASAEERRMERPRRTTVERARCRVAPGGLSRVAGGICELRRTFHGRWDGLTGGSV